MNSSIPIINAGGGRVTVRSHGPSASFSELSATYPLKLLSPRVALDGVAIAYILSYGGGLVGGDSIKLAVDVGPGSILLLLSQVRLSSFQSNLSILICAGIYKSLQDSIRQQSGLSTRIVQRDNTECHRSHHL
jgi:urease accessory protein